VLEIIATTYGAPDEVADAYRSTEQQVRAALAPPKRQQHQSLMGRFFGVYGDSRAWTSLFYMLLALATGIVYFTVAVTGLSLSVGLAILIVGIPFFLLFVGFTRVLSLAEGRLVEGLLGERMPRRPPYPQQGKPFGQRIKEMLVDWRTWTTMLYFLLMLPLGIVYFIVAVAGLSASVSLIVGPFVALFAGNGGLYLDGVYIVPEPTLGLVTLPLGILLLTLVLHLFRGLGTMHGGLAKHLLVAQSRAD
jgi:hypothetical protein